MPRGCVRSPAEARALLLEEARYRLGPKNVLRKYHKDDEALEPSLVDDEVLAMDRLASNQPLRARTGEDPRPRCTAQSATLERPAGSGARPAPAYW